MTHPSLAVPGASVAAHAPAHPSRGRDLFLPLALLGVLGALARAVWFTPVEAMQGPAQKIFYVHVPAATVGLYVGLPIVALCSAMYLWLRDERLDRVAESAAEVSLVFLTAVLVTGPLWGKPVWGTWWTWDARLTLTLFLWFVLLGYTIMRGAVEDRQQRARFSAVLGLLAMLLVPFIHLSVNLFRTLHPQAIVLKPSAPSLPPQMLTTLGIAFLATVVLFAALLRARVRYAADRELLSLREEGA